MKNQIIKNIGKNRDLKDKFYTNFNISQLCIQEIKKFNLYQKNDILLFGRESAGVPEEIHHCVDARLLIPMQKGLRSLNVSSAASMIVGEALRQLNRF